MVSLRFTSLSAIAFRPRIKMRGRRRRRTASEVICGEEELHQRVKLKTVRSVEKRLMDSHVLTRDTAQQHKELMFRAFSYSSKRLIILLLLFTKDFYTAWRYEWLYMATSLSYYENAETYYGEVICGC